MITEDKLNEAFQDLIDGIEFLERYEKDTSKCMNSYMFKNALNILKDAFEGYDIPDSSRTMH